MDPSEAYIQRMWILWLMAPHRETFDGKSLDLGEIGSVAEKNWTKATPYSPAQESR